MVAPNLYSYRDVVSPVMSEIKVLVTICSIPILGLKFFLLLLNEVRDRGIRQHNYLKISTLDAHPIPTCLDPEISWVGAARFGRVFGNI
jgi:hypothetical protein